MSRLDVIEEQASVWLAREDRCLSDEERAAFDAWLSEDTAHRVCFLRLKALWQKVDRLGGQDLPETPDAPAKRAVGVAWRAIAATMLVALLGTSAWYQSARTAPSMETGTVYATNLGQSQSVRLTDGTTMQLNTNTRLRQTMTPTARVVMLDRGEAYFDVAKDPQRPFIVYAGNREITDIGTKFSVRREGDGVEVLIAEGRVRVGLSTGAVGKRSVEAGTGNIVVAKADGTLVAMKSRQNIVDRLSWREGVLVFNQEALGAVAAEFNRYNAKHIIVVGAARDLPIGGRFRVENVEVFTSLIKEGFGLKIEDTGTEIIVSE